MRSLGFPVRRAEVPLIVHQANPDADGRVDLLTFRLISEYTSASMYTYFTSRYRVVFSPFSSLHTLYLAMPPPVSPLSLYCRLELALRANGRNMRTQVVTPLPALPFVHYCVFRDNVFFFSGEAICQLGSRGGACEGLQTV